MNLNTPINFDIKQFLDWWLDELYRLIPSRIKHYITDISGNVIIRQVDGGYELVFYSLTNEQAPDSYFLDSNNPFAFDELKESLPFLKNSNYILRLSNYQALSRIIFLPEIAKDNIEQVVAYEIDRITPFNAESVYFRAAPIAKADNGQIQVQLVICRKEVLENHINTLNAMGIYPGFVDCEIWHDNSSFSRKYNLLPDRLQPQLDKKIKLINAVTNSVLMILGLVVLLWPLLQESNDVDQLKSEIKAIEKQTDEIIEKKNKFTVIKSQSQHLIDYKKDSPSMVAVLNELSRILTDDTWLLQLNFNSKRLQILGYSKDASALIGLLESSDFFSNVNFTSPLTQDKSTGKERFELSMLVASPVLNTSSPDAESLPQPATDAKSENQNSDGGLNNE